QVFGNVASPGAFVLSGLNDIQAQDKVTFTGAGLVAAAKTRSLIVTKQDLARVQVGSNALLQSVGQIDFMARGTANVRTAIEAETYGAATYTAADSSVRITADNQIDVASGATVRAKRDLNLYAGMGPDFSHDAYALD